MIDRASILRALDHLHPGGFVGFDPAKPTPHNYAEYLAWIADGEKPLTEAEIEAAAAAYVDPAEARAASRAALRAQWDGLPSWIRGPFQDKFAAANALLDTGDDEAAAMLIAYAEAPSAYSPDQAAAFAAIKAAMMAGIGNLPA